MDATKAFLLGFGKIKPLFINAVFSCFLHILWSYAIAIYFGYGMIGLGLAKSLTDFFQFANITFLVSTDKSLK